MSRVKEFLKENKAILKYILFLFVTTRIVLTFVGVTSRIYFDKVNPTTYIWKYSDHLWLDIWGIWDSGYYLDIAKRGYADNQDFQFPVSIIDNEYGKRQTNYGFFPLYPILIKLVAIIVRDYYTSALIISNLCFLAAGYFLYKLVKIHFNDKVAKGAVKYLFFFPTAFIYSGVITESLALLTIVLFFYYAEMEKWLRSSVFAALLSLTKFTGFLTLIPLALIARYKGEFKNSGFWLASMLIPITLSLFLGYTWITSGSPLTHFDTKINGWAVTMGDPIKTFALLFQYSNPKNSLSGIYQIITAFTIFQALLLVIAYKKIPFPYWIIWFILYLLTIFSGLSVSIGMPRHSLLLFPQYMVFAVLSKNFHLNKLMTGTFITFQILLMILWVNGAIL